MRVIMFGPGGGHNAAGFIDFFKKNSSYECIYICKGKTSWKSGGNLKVLTYNKTFSSEVKKILNKESFIWVHGGYDIKQLLAILFHRNKNSFVSINLWGEQVALMSLKNNIKGFLYRYIFNKVNLLHCNWHGVNDLIKASFKNTTVQPWGLVDSFIESSKEELHSFTLDFINNLPKNKFKFFYPKSILPVSGQIEVIEACKILKEKSQDLFIVYLWCGNVADEVMKANCIRLIKEYGLVDIVKIVEHPYLPFKDIKEIWREMDCGLQIAKSDQLSTSFLEPQYLKKNIIATSIAPYVVYNNIYKTKLDLVNIDSQEIAKSMDGKIKKTISDTEQELEYRKNVIEKEFSFSKNINKFIKTTVRTTGNGSSH